MDEDKKGEFKPNKEQIVFLFSMIMRAVLDYDHQLYMHRLNFLKVKITPHPGDFLKFAEKYTGDDFIKKFLELAKTK